ncbi:Hypothetical_protein [Hexamita inflata]|uniref:Hypothetical_protein n=1 Tax=Hexamita inflata TaxID=28002 RepID=A0AA86U5K9_9EUKA|nr:Hypothetical protein HINF_LOCUS29442 [Hexamita inflata]CAI9941799.1 Hypothetical protein HINF_LOCUS29444 [Hexamita inflata]CAI9941801.1 Hypothetical protein HINF_LOCUS29446 [Hexamita inflata]CAI9941803.1 Hypothetical protein HINF_LOCUS29448 [Hexamita inflata]
MSYCVLCNQWCFRWQQANIAQNSGWLLFISILLPYLKSTNVLFCTYVLSFTDAREISTQYEPVDITNCVLQRQLLYLDCVCCRFMQYQYLLSVGQYCCKQKQSEYSVGSQTESKL